MITLHDDNINSFIDKICLSEDEVLVNLYGYKMYIYPSIGRENVRLAVLRKLRQIKDKEINLERLRLSESFSEKEIEKISSLEPDEISDILFETSLYPHRSKQSVK